MLRHTQRVTMLCALALATALTAPLHADHHELWVVYDGSNGPGNGKHIVLISGDEEYRSEESLPQLGKILAVHHGFKCTVLFAIDKKSGEIDPETINNIPGLEALESADLMIIFTRFRNLPDGQMKYVDDYLKSGRPVIGMRTATHAFQVPRNQTYRHYADDYRGEQRAWQGGFGRLVLGEKWISHHGRHGDESTGGIIAPGAADHPILRGIEDRDIWGATDVYGVRLPLPGDSKPLVLGAVLEGMDLNDPRLEGDRNDPMMPVAWTKTYQLPGGKQGRVFATTMGASQDLIAEGTRRMLVNATYWCVNLEDQIPAESNVDLVGSYKPTPFGFGECTRGVRPADHKMQ